MGLKLDEHQLETYRQQGFLFPLPVLPDAEVNTLRAKLEDLEQQQGGRLPESRICYCRG
jgi:hypothetical protein